MAIRKKNLLTVGKKHLNYPQVNQGSLESVGPPVCEEERRKHE